MIELYEDEIFHLDEGGNLGAASDLLRTLSPIYSLGTYTDFDVHIDTRKLPPVLKVKEPILINFDKSTSRFCNDILIVTDPVRAFEFIKIIQRAMIDACIPNPSKKSHLQLDSLKFRQEECQKKMLDDCLSLGYSIRQYRNFASRVDDDIASSIIDNNFIISFEELLKLLESQPAESQTEKSQTEKSQTEKSQTEKSQPAKSQPAKSQPAKSQPAKSQPAVNKKNQNVFNYGQYMTLKAVINTTGPNLYINAIQQYIKYNLTKMILLYQTCGFISTYKLNDYFKVQVLGSNNNDASWLPSGVNKLREQERKMNDSAQKIQTIYKKHTESEKKKNEIKMNDSAQKIQTIYKKYIESKKEKNEIKIAPPSENVSKTIK